MLADDPIFGRFCFGGEWRKISRGIAVVPRDGLRRRFHAMLETGKLHLVLDNDRFASEQPIVLRRDFAEISFQLESDNPAEHVAKLNVSGLSGSYILRGSKGQIASLKLKENEEVAAELPMDPSHLQTFELLKKQ
ncbi:hypothetical protein SBV1_640004 [Verrucomicrobia bacterium]|nr:hypothetical protein SBV1_640004 [Verrucomicrobiota bacterium]